MTTEEIQGIDFTVDQSNLYREEGITDLKVASIRRLIPIKRSPYIISWANFLGKSM